jgi:hypothetical protein
MAVHRADASKNPCHVERKSGRIAPMKTPIPHLLIVLLTISLGSLQNAHAVSPPADGGYPGGNTAEGQNALQSLTTGGFNAAVGYFSLFANTTGFFNTAVGAGALDLNTADNNTAVGAAALLLNTTGSFNTATGVDALVYNDTGGANTANGAFALFGNTTGASNTAIGDGALSSNTSGSGNTANGVFALGNSGTGDNNTAVGFEALIDNTIGASNTAVGFDALLVNTIGAGNTALGFSAGANLTTGNNNIDIGNLGVADESNTIRIGGDVGLGPQTKTFVEGIRGVTAGNADAIPVLIDSAGQLGTASSSRRYKTDIKPIDTASESILGLKPVSFRYKVHKDSTPQFGLISEDVAQVNRDLVIYDADGKPYTVRYDAVNAMLLNEFLKEHRKNEQQRKDFEAAIAQQHKDFEAAVAELKGEIQRVSAQLQVSKPAPQTALNNH